MLTMPSSEGDADEALDEAAIFFFGVCGYRPYEARIWTAKNDEESERVLRPARSVLE